MLTLLIILATVGALVWWLAYSVPPNISSNTASTLAIDNIHNWLVFAMGPRWPVVLGVITVLLLALLVAIAGASATITVDPVVSKLVAVATLGVVGLMTSQWRTKYTDQNIEFAIILLMLGLNSYLIYKTD